MKKLIGLMGGLAILAWSGAASAETSLRAISFLPKNHPVVSQVAVWVNEVNEAMKGDLKVNWVGGSEVVPLFQQPEALRNGVVDMLFAPTVYYLDQMPSALAFALSKLSPSEERKSGFYDYMVKDHAKMNARYLGRVHAEPFYLFTKKEPKSLAEMKGLKMRTGSLYDRFMQKMGMIPVTIPAPETYTALESGVVDGFGWPASGIKKLGWSKQTKFALDLPFFGASNVVILVNQAKWEKLTAAQQKKLVDMTAAYEPRMVKYFADNEAKEWSELLADGVKKIKFSDADNKSFYDIAYETEWSFLEGKLGATETAKLRKLTGN